MSKRKRNPKSRSDLPQEIPDEFLERLSKIIPEPFFDSVRRSFFEPRHVGFRINPLVTNDRNAVLQKLDDMGLEYKRLEWFENGFFVEASGRELLLESDPVRHSEIYVQNPSSILPCLVLAPQPEEQILDLAAAPGGKTLLMTAMMEDRGWISAVEPIRTRFFKLQANLKRYGASIVKTYLMDGRQVGRKVGERFDRVLLDTPCSGESRIHESNPESFQFWSPRKLKEQARKQFGLIRSGYSSLKPGGTLVYCTCSFAPEENEVIVDDFLTENPESELIEIDLPESVNSQKGLTEWNGKSLRSELEKTVRVLPDPLMNGFYIAGLKKPAK